MDILELSKSEHLESVFQKLISSIHDKEILEDINKHLWSLLPKTVYFDKKKYFTGELPSVIKCAKPHLVMKVIDVLNIEDKASLFGLNYKTVRSDCMPAICKACNIDEFILIYEYFDLQKILTNDDKNYLGKRFLHLSSCLISTMTSLSYIDRVIWGHQKHREVSYVNYDGRQCSYTSTDANGEHVHIKKITKKQRNDLVSKNVHPALLTKSFWANDIWKECLSVEEENYFLSNLLKFNKTTVDTIFINQPSLVETKEFVNYYKETYGPERFIVFLSRFVKKNKTLPKNIKKNDVQKMHQQVLFNQLSNKQLSRKIKNKTVSRAVNVLKKQCNLT